MASDKEVTGAPLGAARPDRPPRGRPAPTPEEQRSIERVVERGFGAVPPRLARERRRDVTLDCGWGRIVFGQTFDDPARIAATLQEELPGRRDVCLYARDPQVVIGSSPQELFLDPSHTYRLLLHHYRPGRAPVRGVAIRALREPGDADAVDRIYRACGMVPAPAEALWANQRTPVFTYLVAEDQRTGEVIGSVTGVDHVAAFGDPEGGTSLWCLAVDPHTTRPGVGEALVRTLVERYQAMGRNFLDLSVMHDNDPAIQLYEKLGFRRVPVFCIKRKNPINEPLFLPSQTERIDELNPYARLLVDEAVRRGIEVEVLDPSVGEVRYTLGSRSVLAWESLSELTSAVAMARCDDKVVTRRVLTEAGLRVARGRLATDDEGDQRFLEEVGQAVVKPARGEQGQGITVGVRSPEALHSAVAVARAHCPRVLIEERVAGDDLRIIVIDDEVVAAAVRRPAAVVGTGRHTVGQLIESQSRRRAAVTGGESRIPVDTTTTDTLAESGYALDDVVPEGEHVAVRRTANLHTGGTIHDVTDLLHPALADVARRAARAIGIPVTGLDLIVTDVGGPEYVVIEANERPGLANHEPQPTAARFIDLLFPATSSLPRAWDQHDDRRPG